MDKNSSLNDYNKLILFRRSLIYQTKEFFDNSTLHGVRYIAENGRSLCEKFMWFCLTTIALVTALIIIMSLWEKFQTNPTITGVEVGYPDTQLIFPTVTFCPIIPFDEELTYNIIFEKHANYENSTTQQILKFYKILSILNFNNIPEAINLSETFKETFPLKNVNLRELIFEVLIPVEKIMEDCSFKGVEKDCEKIFFPIYTEKGLCYAFNSRFKSTKDADIEETDMEILDKDKDWTLRLVQKQETNVFITRREEYFGANTENELTLIDFSVQVLIAFKSTYTIEEARQLSIKQRKCIFDDEVTLKLLNQQYTLSGCMIECRLKKSMKFCNCIPPFYRPIKSYRMCNIDELMCLNKFKINITTIQDCPTCELDCEDDVYRIERHEKRSEDKFLNIRLFGWPALRYRREILFGWTDLFVSFGGIAGLFLGFSMLSGVEIIYYFTIRACCMMYKDKRELYAVEQDIMRKSIPKINMSLLMKQQQTIKNKSIRIKVRPISSNNNFVLKTSSTELRGKNNDHQINSNYNKDDFLEWYKDRLKYRSQQFGFIP